MRKLASIQKIIDVSPIEGADRIALVHVLGWQCVSKKGEFKPGDLCVYFEIDSFLPIEPQFEFLRDSSFRKSELLGEGFRLKTMKFRGQYSQGLVLPIDAALTPEQQASITELSGEIQEGTDVSELLGVRKWEIPEKATGQGTIIGEANKYIPITDEMRIQSAPELLKEFAGLDYYITTKLDGSSHSIMIDEEGVFHVLGHNYELKQDDACDFYKWLKERDIPEKLADVKTKLGLSTIAVQGEWCGGGIQSNPMKLKALNWYVFTVNENRKRVGLKEMLNVAKALGTATVPIQEVGHDLPAKYPDEKALLERCETEVGTKMYPGAPEGIVIRPVEPVYSKALGGPLSMKVKSNRYLLKHEDA